MWKRFDLTEPYSTVLKQLRTYGWNFLRVFAALLFVGAVLSSHYLLIKCFPISKLANLFCSQGLFLDICIPVLHLQDEARCKMMQVSTNCRSAGEALLQLRVVGRQSRPLQERSYHEGRGREWLRSLCFRVSSIGEGQTYFSNRTLCKSNVTQSKSVSQTLALCQQSISRVIDEFSIINVVFAIPFPFFCSMAFIVLLASLIRPRIMLQIIIVPYSTTQLRSVTVLRRISSLISLVISVLACPKGQTCYS